MNALGSPNEMRGRRLLSARGTSIKIKPAGFFEDRRRVTRLADDSSLLALAAALFTTRNEPPP